MITMVDEVLNLKVITTMVLIKWIKGTQCEDNIKSDVDILLCV